MTRVVVAGRGIVGTRATRTLTSPAVGRAALEVESADRVEELAGPPGPGDVVLLATGGRHAPVAAHLGRLGASVVSVADGLDDVCELLALDDLFRRMGSTLVVGAAMSPGLSGLLARHLAADIHQVEELHVAFHATAGPACARQHHRALAGRAVGWHDGAWIERPAGSGRELCWFPEPVGAHDCYRAALPDPVLLHRSFVDVSRISARVSATRRDRLTARLPMLRRPHGEGGVGALRVEVRGQRADGTRVSAIAGIAETVGTAAAATSTAMTGAILDGLTATGVVTTSDDALPSPYVLAAVRAAGIRFQEFTGVPQRG